MGVHDIVSRPETRADVLTTLPRTGGVRAPAEVVARTQPHVGWSIGEIALHSDAASDRAVRRLGARALTLGDQVYLSSAAPPPGTAAGDRLLVHELVHTTQTGPPGSLSRATPAQEASASQVAERVSSGGPPPHAAGRGGAESGRGGGARLSLPRTTGGPGPVLGPPVLGLDLLYAQQLADNVENLLGGTSSPGPLVDPGGARAAAEYLGTLTEDDLVDTLVVLDGRGHLETVVGAMRPADPDSLTGPAFAVMSLSTRGRSTSSWGILAAHALSRLPAATRQRLLEKVLTAMGRGDEIAALREGLSVIEESEAELAAAPEEEVEEGTPPETVFAGVTMLPWNPGNQPIPFYLGNEAHVQIAMHYASRHRSDTAFYNYSSIATILAAARAAGIALGTATATAVQLGLKPDIANLTRLHLYEIKPVRLQSLGRTEARLYQAAFAAAGLAMTLGPMTESGTSGTVPAPGGWYVFSAPESGVITYRYRQPRRRRVRVRVPVPAPRRVPAADRSFMEEMSAITGLTGTALIIYLIISEGSRLFPPRNLVPVP